MAGTNSMTVVALVGGGDSMAALVECGCGVADDKIDDRKLFIRMRLYCVNRKYKK